MIMQQICGGTIAIICAKLTAAINQSFLSLFGTHYNLFQIQNRKFKQHQYITSFFNKFIRNAYIRGVDGQVHRKRFFFEKYGFIRAPTSRAGDFSK